MMYTTNNLLPAMKLSAQNLLNSLNKDCRMLPYWKLYVNPDYTAFGEFRWVAHNLGRWWDAMLRLEEATGYEIPIDAETAMLQNLELFLNNEDHICVEPDDLQFDQITPYEIHSSRETLLALTMLIRRRNLTWAKNAAHAMLETLDRIVRPDGNVAFEDLAYAKSHPDAFMDMYDATNAHGRLIEALVPYYEETGDELAFRFAERLANWHFDNSTKPDGTMTGLDIKHTHSYLGTLRGLFLFGKLTGQRRFIDRVWLTYQTTVRVLVKESGYASHDIGSEDRPETTSPGDAAQLALWLALDGHPECLDEAERIIRARILPSQIWETPALTPTGTGEDRYTNLEERILGGFGGMMQKMHGGKLPTTDVSCADLHTLTDIYNHIIVETPHATRVLFHFCKETSNVTVHSDRIGTRATVRVESRTGKMLEIRVPAWTPVDRLCVTVNGEPAAPIVQDHFLRIFGTSRDLTVTVSYDLPEKVIKEVTNGTEYEIAFRGDEITGISPNTDFYPLYANL